MLGGPPVGLADENLQSRIRGLLLMAVSNAKGWIVLTTGNKSELATGYSTLYGDSAGGFAVIKDVPKTLVYRLCVERNRSAGTPLIPQAVLDKPPSAELRPDQRDDQALPRYEILDPVLDALVNDDRSVAEVVADGYDAELVIRVAGLVDSAEYKRRQSPLGVRISPRAFGKDRRMPITNRYRGSFYGLRVATTAHRHARSAGGRSWRVTPTTTGDQTACCRAPGLTSPPRPVQKSLPLDSAARVVGAYQWIEQRLFEILGGWVAVRSRSGRPAAVRHHQPPACLARRVVRAVPAGLGVNSTGRC